MRRAVSLFLTSVVFAASMMAVLAGAGPASAAPDPSLQGARYVPVAPVRALDTRFTGAPLGPAATLRVDLRRFLPVTARAAVVTVTATDPSAAGFLTVFTHGVSRPNVSSLNKRAGETRSNTMTVALPADGSRSIDVFNQAGRTHVIIDAVGYYDPTVLTGDYYPQYTPLRVLDTRSSGLRGDGTESQVDVPYSGTTEVTSALAVIITVVATGPGYVTAWDGKTAEPPVSTVNYGFDPATANSTIVPVTATNDGFLHFTVRNHVGSAAVLVDVVGYYSNAHGDGAVYRVTPQSRILDTRNDPDGALGPDFSADVALPDTTGGTRQVVSAALNVTAVNATAPTYVTVWGSTAPHPNASSLNPSSPAPVANGVLTSDYSPRSAPGEADIFHVYNYAGRVDLVLDLQGVFILDPDATAPLS